MPQLIYSWSKSSPSIEYVKETTPTEAVLGLTSNDLGYRDPRVTQYTSYTALVTTHLIVKLTVIVTLISD